MFKKILLLCPLTILSGCAYLTPAPKPIAIQGSFKVTLITSAKFIKGSKQYPVSGTLTNDTPFMSQEPIPAGTPIFGVYKNGGLACSITWITIAPVNNAPLSNSSGIATTRCFAGSIIKESETLTATWN